MEAEGCAWLWVEAGVGLTEVLKAGPSRAALAQRQSLTLHIARDLTGKGKLMRPIVCTAGDRDLCPFPVALPSPLL